MSNKLESATNEALFSFFDENNDGGITLPELECALAGVGVKFSDADLTAFFTKYDADGNGVIDFCEFMALSMSLNSLNNGFTDSESAMGKLFTSIDKDHNKMLTKEEIKEGIKKFTGKPADDAEIAALFKQLDLDGDEKISYQEFAGSILTKIALAIKVKSDIHQSE